MFIPNSRPWRFLFSALVLSSFGDQFTRIALYAWVSELGGGVSGLTALAAVESFASVAGSATGGILGDRGAGIRSLVVLDVARSGLLVSLIMTEQLVAVIIVAGLLAASSGAYSPIEGALEPDLLDGERDLASANSARGAAFNVVGSLGPAAAGIAIGAFGTRSAFSIDAITFLVAIILLTRVGKNWTSKRQRDPRTRVETSTRLIERAQSSLANYRTALGIALGVKEVRLCLSALAVLTLILGFQGPAIFTITNDRFDNGPTIFGLYMALIGIGAVVGSILVGRMTNAIAIGARLVYFTMLIDAIALAWFVASEVLMFNLIAMFFLGGISGVATVVIRHTIQSRSPESVRARALSLMRIVDGPLMFMSLAVFASLLVVTSVKEIVYGSAVLEFVAGLVGLLILYKPRTAT